MRHLLQLRLETKREIRPKFANFIFKMGRINLLSILRAQLASPVYFDFDLSYDEIAPHQLTNPQPLPGRTVGSSKGISIRITMNYGIIDYKRSYFTFNLPWT